MASGSTPPFSFTDVSDPGDGRWPAGLGPLAGGCAVPAHAFGSGLLDQMGGVGAHAIPLRLALPIKDAIARGDIVVCWISGQPILAGYLDIDHVIPFSFGGATNSANLRPAGMSANRSRGNTLDLLRERKIGWKWDLDQHGRRVRVPDTSQRLVRVFTQEGEAVYFSVPKFNVGEFAGGAAGSAGLALAIEGAMQWRRREFHPDDLGEQAAKAAAGYAASYSAKIGVKALAPRAMALGVDAAGVEALGSLAGPVGFVAAIYAVEAVEQVVALARREVTPGKAATRFVLAPIGVAKDTAGLVVYGYKFVSPRHRAIRTAQRKWRSINFVPDLKRPDPAEVLALSNISGRGHADGPCTARHAPARRHDARLLDAIDPSITELAALDVEAATGAWPGWAAA
jgi:hypothetical protein